MILILKRTQKIVSGTVILFSSLNFIVFWLEFFVLQSNNFFVLNFQIEFKSKISGVFSLTSLISANWLKITT